MKEGENVTNLTHYKAKKAVETAKANIVLEAVRTVRIIERVLTDDFVLLHWIHIVRSIAERKVEIRNTNLERELELAIEAMECVLEINRQKNKEG